jgi:hypothetical protein
VIRGYVVNENCISRKKHFWATCFTVEKLCSNFDKNGLALVHFGRFFHSLIWSPGSHDLLLQVTKNSKNDSIIFLRFYVPTSYRYDMYISLPKFFTAAPSDAVESFASTFCWKNF